MRCLVLIVTGMAAALATHERLWGEDAPGEQQLGRGMRLYFARDVTAAHGQLSEAIASGAGDPRGWYFRGLCLLELGRRGEAEADFSRGAALEAEDLDQFYDVGRLLARVQGPERLLLERFRAEARKQMAEARQRERLERFKRLLESGSPLPATAAPAGGGLQGGEPAAGANPFGN